MESLISDSSILARQAPVAQEGNLHRPQVNCELLSLNWLHSCGSQFPECPPTNWVCVGGNKSLLFLTMHTSWLSATPTQGGHADLKRDTSETLSEKMAYQEFGIGAAVRHSSTELIPDLETHRVDPRNKLGLHKSPKHSALNKRGSGKQCQTFFFCLFSKKARDL